MSRNCTPNLRALELQSPRRRAIISLTPLIDVVFILLVFFMLASSFLDWRAIELQSPAETGGAGRMEGSALLEVRAGDLRLGGEVMAASEAAERLVRQRSENPSLRVLVRPDPGVSLQRTVDVLDRLDAAGIQDLAVIRDSAQ